MPLTRSKKRATLDSESQGFGSSRDKRFKSSFTADDEELIELISDGTDSDLEITQTVIKSPTKMATRRRRIPPTRSEKTKSANISPIKNIARTSKSNSCSPTKTSITSLGDSVRKFNSLSVDKIDECSQWVDKYAPTDISEVAIHPRKAQDVKDMLSKMLNGKTNTRLLILSGPAGSSKSTVTKLLADNLLSDSHSSNHNLVKYFSDTEQTDKKVLKWIEYEDSNLLSSRTNSFSEFLNDARYKVGSNLSVIIVEDLPNIFHQETRLSFQKAITDWIYTEGELPPLVLCLTETDITNSSEHEAFNIENCLNTDTLLGKNITSHPKVSIIKFNPIAKTYIMRPVKKIIERESSVFRNIHRTEIDNFLANVILTGDIRSVIFCLQFWASWKHRNNSKDGNYLSFGRQNQINLFHGIGKTIFGSSKTSDDVSDADGLGYKADYHTIKDVLDSFSRSSLLQLSLLENYCNFNDKNIDLQIISDIADNLSTGDILGNIDEGYEVGIRGTRTNLRIVQESNNIVSGVPGQHGNKDNMIKFSRHLKVVREYNKTRSEINQYKFQRNYRDSFDDLNLYAGYYEPLILNSKRYKSRVGAHTHKYIPRVGGSFKQIISDTNVPFLLDEDNVISEPSKEESNSIGNDSESELSDPIQSSGDEKPVFDDKVDKSDSDSEDVFNDSFDGHIDVLLSQNQPSESINVNTASLENRILNSNILKITNGRRLGGKSVYISSQESELSSDSDLDNII